MKITHLVFVDVETTALKGPASQADAIIEVAAARVELTSRRIEDQFETLIRPWGEQSTRWGLGAGRGDIPDTWKLGDFHTKAGHFDGVDWSTAVDLDVALDVLATRFLIDGATIAGQNPGFDLDHLRRDFVNHHRPWPKLDYHVIDLVTGAMFLAMAGKVEGCSLRHVIPWAYVDPDRKQAHRAGQDVRDEIQVFFAMADQFMHGIRPQISGGPMIGWGEPL
jgi:DNA polymerase III epsilon subunit-like protein